MVLKIYDEFYDVSLINMFTQNKYHINLKIWNKIRIRTKQKKEKQAGAELCQAHAQVD